MFLPLQSSLNRIAMAARGPSLPERRPGTPPRAPEKEQRNTRREDAKNDGDQGRIAIALWLRRHGDYVEDIVGLAAVRAGVGVRLNVFGGDNGAAVVGSGLMVGAAEAKATSPTRSAAIVAFAAQHANHQELQPRTTLSKTASKGSSGSDKSRKL